MRGRRARRLRRIAGAGDGWVADSWNAGVAHGRSDGRKSEEVQATPERLTALEKFRDDLRELLRGPSQSIQ